MFSKKFIKATKNYCTFEKHLNAPYMRKVFNAEDIKSAKITITSSGFYELYFNGINITKSPLSPYITNPDSALIYDEYDITEKINSGKNALGFILGNGMVNCIGGYVWKMDEVPYRSAPAIAFALEITHTNGTIEIIEADETIKVAQSPITFDDIRCGVHYDARLEQKNWCGIDFDDSAWQNGIIAEEPRGDKMLKDTDNLILSRVLTPKRIFEGGACLQFSPDVSAKAGSSREISKTAQYKPDENEKGYIYDFGENVAFVPTLKIKGKRGQKIVLQFGEYLVGNDISYENVDRFYPYGYTQRDVFICSGNEDVFTPPFTYHSAQYCLVIGLTPEQATNDLLTFNVLHSDIKTVGTFSCSSDTANRLYDCVRRSDLSNFIYYPLDCPHREKNGWTGDAAVSAEQFVQQFNIEKSIRQWLKLIKREQRLDGAIPGIIPTGGWGFDYYNGPAWDQVIVEFPYRIYQYRGDLSAFTENADMIMRYINYLTVLRDKNGLITYNGLGDYVQIGRPASYHACPAVVSSTIFAKYICEKAEFLFNEAGMKSQARFAGAVKDEFVSAIRNHLIDKNTMTVYGACQSSQALGLYYNIFEPGERTEAYNVLLKIIHSDNDLINCGVLGLRAIFHCLADFGNAELAWKMITRLDGPSFGSIVVKNNLNTLIESFHEPMYYKLPSLNHHFLGDFVNFFKADVAGLRINPSGNDCKHIEIKPAFIDELDFADATYETVSGKVTVSWKKLDKGYTISVEHPEDVTCSLIIPSGYMTDDNIPRSYDYNFNGTINLRKYENLGRGNY